MMNDSPRIGARKEGLVPHSAILISAFAACPRASSDDCLLKSKTSRVGARFAFKRARFRCKKHRPGMDKHARNGYH